MPRVLRPPKAVAGGLLSAGVSLLASAVALGAGVISAVHWGGGSPGPALPISIAAALTASLVGLAASRPVGRNARVVAVVASGLGLVIVLVWILVLGFFLFVLD